MGISHYLLTAMNFMTLPRVEIDGKREEKGDIKMKWLDKIPYTLLILASLTLGLAPFVPMPHVVEKLMMLQAGELVRPIDIFDLVMHASPFVLLAAKIVRSATSLGKE
jgi:hypothetical protein